VAKAYLAPSRIVYLRRHWFDVLIVVLPFLRPLRLMRSASGVRVLGVARLVPVLGRIVYSAKFVLNQHGLKYVLLAGLLIMLLSAGLITLFERNDNGSIRDFDDGLWWAATTITTVGYGDKFPVSHEGRGIAIFLMLVGISMFSILTANIASFFVKTSEDPGPSLNDIMAKLQRLETEIAALRGNAGGPSAEKASDLP
jgi:voltage-gated potassium channel